MNRFKVNNSMAFSTVTILCNCHLDLVPKNVRHPKGSPIPIIHSSPSPSPPSSWQPLIFLSLEMYLCWTLCTNETIHCVTICVWLLSFSVIFSRFIPVVVCVSTSFLFCGQIIFHCMARPLFVYAFSHSRAFDYSHLLAICE